MTREAKDFYGQNIALFAKVGSGLYDPANDEYRKQQHSVTDWVRLTAKEINDYFKDIRSIDQANIRVNLMKNLKNPANPGEVLFASNLPDVVVGTDIWYSSKYGASAVKAQSTDFLRALYTEVYNSGSALATPNIETDVRARSKGGFNLNFGKFISAVMKREDDLNAQRAKATLQPSHAQDEDLSVYPFLTAYDMVYGKVWTYDQPSQLYYREENGRRVWYNDEAKGDTATCYASYL
jgi:hypothetical protein